MFDINKPFTTRDGREVRILYTDGPGDWPIVGIIGDNTCIDQWNEMGENRNSYAVGARNLINPPPKPIDLGWIVLWPGYEIDQYYDQKPKESELSNNYIAIRHLSFVDGKIVDNTEEME